MSKNCEIVCIYKVKESNISHATYTKQKRKKKKKRVAKWL